MNSTAFCSSLSLGLIILGIYIFWGRIEFLKFLFGNCKSKFFDAFKDTVISFCTYLSELETILLDDIFCFLCLYKKILMNWLYDHSHFYFQEEGLWYFYHSSYELQESRSFKYLKEKKVQSNRRPWWYRQHLYNKLKWWFWIFTVRQYPRFGTWWIYLNAEWFWILIIERVTWSQLQSW